MSLFDIKARPASEASEKKYAIKKSPGNSQANGFSLAELIVSLFIIAMISGLFLANYRSAGRRSELVNTVQLAVVNIRASQGYSVGSKLYGASVPSGGWGVYFDTTANNNKQYIVFADANGNKLYDGAAEAIETYDAKTVPFPANIETYSISVAGSPVTSAAIVFLPPDPLIYINAAQNGSAIITFREKIGSSTVAVEVNPFGLVDVSR